uniref:hypothetical protein n=1 Tax=Rhizomonospora bruguierae TaxID=1581705 RepID=UPI001BD1179B
MTDRADAARAQLADELGAVATALSAILGTDIHAILTQRIAERAGWLVAELESGALPDEIATDLLAVLWPHSDPDLEWWRTPLGLLVAPTWMARL